MVALGIQTQVPVMVEKPDTKFSLCTIPLNNLGLLGSLIPVFSSKVLCN